MAKELSEGIRGQIIALSNKGFSQRKIAAKIKLSKGAVQQTLERFRDTGSYSTKRRSGRPRATTLKEDQYIKTAPLCDRTATAGNIQSIVNESREKSISRSTEKRTLVEHGLNGRVAASKPLLRSQNKQKRLLWARKYRGYTKKDWEKVLFADESKFEIFGNKRRIYVRRRKNEKFVSSCLKTTVKHGGGNIQVWGCFSDNGVGDLYKIKNTLEKRQHHSILQRHAIPSGLRLCGKGICVAAR